MGKLISIWSFIRRRSISLRSLRLLLSLAFLDENSLVRRFGYEREISQLKEEIEKVPGRLRREYQASQRNNDQSGRHRANRP